MESMPLSRAVRRREALALLTGAAVAAPASFLPRGGFALELAPADPSALNLGVGIDDASRVTVPMSIAGQGPFTFLVDTASQRTVIAAELAGQLGLAEGPTVTVHTLSGAVDVGTAILPKFEIEGRGLAPKAAPKFAQRHIGAMGMLGLDALRSQRVVLNLRDASMAINAEPVVAPDWEGDTILGTARSRLGQLILTNAGLGLNDDSISVIIDTGAQFSVGNDALRRFILRAGGLGDVQKMDLYSVTGTTTVADYIVVRQLRVGGMVIRNLPVAFADVHPLRQLGLNREPALLLGMDALRQFDQIGLNFSRRTVTFYWS